MNQLQFWQQKLIQWLHDPPNKALLVNVKAHKVKKGRKSIVSTCFQRMTSKPLTWVRGEPDWAVSGADRPVVSQPRPKKGEKIGAPLAVYFAKEPVIAHPLMAGAKMALTVPDGEAREVADQMDRIVAASLHAAPTAEDDEAPEVAAEKVRKAVAAQWDNTDELRDVVYWLWRGWLDELRKDEEEGPLWQLFPADTRSPDHSIWDHTRMASALAFITAKEPARQPWLLAGSVGPVQDFIKAARTTRDLWLGSFLVSELSLAAMLKFVEAYGPECIVYPDLHGNARVDAWLRGHREKVLPDGRRDPATFASLIPSSFTALVPRGGGKTGLAPMEEVAQAAQQAVAERWLELVEPVKKWFAGVKPDGRDGWQKVWERQHENVFQFVWSAVQWDNDKAPGDGDARRESLPAQRPHATLAPAKTKNQQAKEAARDARKQRLLPWAGKDTWAHYDYARDVFAAVNAGFIKNERGFDYPFYNAAVRRLLQLRKEERCFAVAPEGGEKCTLCGKREALSDAQKGRSLDSMRAAVRKFWEEEKLDPEGRGAERLCGVCAARRFLVQAWGERSKTAPAGDGAAADGRVYPVNPLQVWFGKDWRKQEDGDGEWRVPFPSTYMISLQDYVAHVATSEDAGVRAAVKEYVRAFREARNAGAVQGFTAFPRALATLAFARWQARRRNDGNAQAFLTIDPQYLLPHGLDTPIRQARSANEQDKAERLIALQKASEKLRKAVRAANKDGKAPALKPRLAVIALDADKLGELFLGEPHRIRGGGADPGGSLATALPGRVGARWRDVLHPSIIRRVKEDDPDGKYQWFRDSKWLTLLEQPRHMGPALDAAISRSLSYFAHTIVPWVVEREYGGRLIYAGGEDVLVLAPAEDALAIAARLQQLLSAAWVVDTRPDEDTWAWRGKDWDPRAESIAMLRSKDRKRFAVPAVTTDKPITWPLERVECYPTDDGSPGGTEACIPVIKNGRIMPMLGRAQSLSAGISIVHAKYPLGAALAHANRLLDDEAKEKTGRRALALSVFSRNGEKATFATRWDKGGGEPTAHLRLQRVMKAFAAGELPRRLAYKLRERSAAALAPVPLLRPGKDGSQQRRDALDNALLAGLVRDALDNVAAAPEVIDDVVALWRQGLVRAGEDDSRAVDGLLVCRMLADGEGV